MPCAVIPQTTLTHCSTKTSTFAPFVVEIAYILELHFTCSCTAVARASVTRARTQLPHVNRHWTCKRLLPDSIRYIRFERKFPICRSLFSGQRHGWKTPGELGVSTSVECDTFPLLCFHIVAWKNLGVSLLVVTIWLELCTSYIAPVVSTTFIQ